MIDPIWIVWHPDGGEDGPSDGRHIRAQSAEAAAEQWAEDWDAGDYALASNEDHHETVKVIMVANDPKVHTFKVRAVISTDYYADEVTP